MTPAELQATLNDLLALPAETEWVEFKEAKNDYDFDDLGEYFSALSNEANLRANPGLAGLRREDKPPEGRRFQLPPAPARTWTA